MKHNPSNALDESGLKPFHPASHLVIHFLFFLGLLPRSRATRAVLFLPILLFSTYILFYRTVGIEDVVSFSIIAQTVFRASDALVLSDVSELKRVGQSQDTNQLGIWDRAKWALDFLFSIRRVGWVDEPKHVLPPRPADSRWQFVRLSIAKCFWYIILADFAQTLVWYYPVDEWRESSIKGIGLRVLGTTVLASVSWSMMSLIYSALAIICVGGGLSDAREWPPLFGNLTDAYTVGRFWGRTWHQIFRRVVSVHGDFIAFRLFGLQKNSILGACVQHYVAFAISGISHSAAEYGLLRFISRKYHHSMLFFFLQATVTIFERAVIKLLGLKAGIWTRAIGYVWTFVWLTITFPPWFDSNIRYGSGVQVGVWKTGSMTNFIWSGKWNYGI